MINQTNAEFHETSSKVPGRVRPAMWSATLGFLCAALPCQGQGTLRINFDGPPVIAPGTAEIVQQYNESGLSFTPIDPDAPFAGFVRRGINPTVGWPDNGTAYVQAGLASSLKLSFANDSLFGVYSVDLAGYSDVVPDFDARFVGYRADGSTVTADFSGSGLNFQTAYFGSDFNNLIRVELPYFGSLDNLVVSVPEPGTWALLILGSGILGLLFAARSRR